MNTGYTDLPMDHIRTILKEIDVVVQKKHEEYVEDLIQRRSKFRTKYNEDTMTKVFCFLKLAKKHNIVTPEDIRDEYLTSKEWSDWHTTCTEDEYDLKSEYPDGFFQLKKITSCGWGKILVANETLSGLLKYLEENDEPKLPD